MDPKLELVRTDRVLSARQLRRVLGTSSRDMRQASAFGTKDGFWQLGSNGQWRFWYRADVWAEKQENAT